MPYTYSKVSNPRYSDEKKSGVVLTVHFDHLSKPHPFLAVPHDTEPHGKQLYAEAIAGKFGAIAPYVAPPPPPAPPAPKPIVPDPALVAAVAAELAKK